MASPFAESKLSNNMTLIKCTDIDANNQNRKRSLDTEHDATDMSTSEPFKKKRRLSNNTPSLTQQQNQQNPFNPLIIQLPLAENPMNKQNEIVKNRNFQKSIITNMSYFDDKKLRQLLLHLIENSDEAVETLKEKFPSPDYSNKEMDTHCVLCHQNYNEIYNGRNSCVLKPDAIEDGFERGACGCGDWDCYNSSCPICGKRFCEGQGDDHCCRIGKHISDKNSYEIANYSVASCDEVRHERCQIDDEDDTDSD